jgi:hypothetical protein
VALFSDIDWIILLAVAAFILLGREGGSILRLFGRYYGRAMRVKQDLLSEFSKAADLPTTTHGPMNSFRALLLQDHQPPPTGTHQIPLAVVVPPVVPIAGLSTATGMGGALGRNAGRSPPHPKVIREAKGDHTQHRPNRHDH